MLKAMLAVALLVAQTFSFAHETDLAAHTGDQLCHVCVSLASLGGANAAPAAIVAAVAVPLHDAPEYVASSSSSRPLKHTFARGPPSAS